MDADALALHAAEPSHLPFGELVNRISQKSFHLIQRQHTQNVLRNELVLKPVVSLDLTVDCVTFSIFEISLIFKSS